MKRMLKWLSLMALVCVFLSACDAFGGSSETNYGYKYPQSCVGGKAVWWTEREGCIDAEPIVKEPEIPGKLKPETSVPETSAPETSTPETDQPAETACMDKTDVK